jgi:hypothetical protein
MRFWLLVIAFDLALGVQAMARRIAAQGFLVWF